MITIKLTEEQAQWVWKTFKDEWDKEVTFCTGDISYLEELLELYKVLLGDSKNDEEKTIKSMEEEIKELKEFWLK